MDFLNYLIYDLNCYRKEKIIFSLVIFSAVVTQIICLQIGGKVSGFIVGILWVLMWLFIVLGVLYLASHFGVAFRKKQTSIQFMMLPVSQSVKFWVRFINQAILPSLLVVLSIAAAIGLAFLVNCFVELEFCSYVQKMLQAKIHGDIPVEILEQLNALMRTLIIYSTLASFATICTMVFGSLVFGRYAVLKTYICMQVISWLTMPFMYGEVKMMVTTNMYSARNGNTPEEALANIVDMMDKMASPNLYVTYIVWFVVLMVASYILFKRKTITRTGL